MDIRKIDLKGKDGVTLIVLLEDVTPGGLFFITVKDAYSPRIFYERMYDKDKVTINLPKHSPCVTLAIIGDPKISSYLITDLQKIDIPFTSPPDTQRPFEIEDLRIQDNYVMETPGRFHTRIPLLEFNPHMMANYSQPVNMFIRLHELGHYQFNDEEKADEWATTMFLNMGYNLSSANQALTQVLSKNPVNLDRMYSQYAYLNAINNQYFQQRAKDPQ